MIYDIDSSDVYSFYETQWNIEGVNGNCGETEVREGKGDGEREGEGEGE